MPLNKETETDTDGAGRYTPCIKKRGSWRANIGDYVNTTIQELGEFTKIR